MKKETAIEIVNKKLQSLGFEFTVDNIGSIWGSSVHDVRYKVQNENIPLLMRSFMKDAKIEMNITFDSEYHDRYNPNPSICIMANILFFHCEHGGGNHKGGGVVQLYCRYPISKGEWDDQTRIGDNTYNLK